MLEVVEQEQHAPIFQTLHERLCQCLAWLFPQPEGRRGRRWHQIRVGQTGKIDQERAVGERLQGFPRHPQPQAGLAHSTRTGQRHQPHVRTQQEVADLLHLALPAQERGGMDGEVMGHVSGGVEGRERRRQCRVVKLEDLLRLQDVAQTVFAEGFEGDSIRQRITQEAGNGVTEEYLSAVCRVEESGEAIERSGEVVAAGIRFGLAGVQRHPHAQGAEFAPVLGQERTLPNDGGGQPPGAR